MGSIQNSLMSLAGFGEDPKVAIKTDNPFLGQLQGGLGSLQNSADKVQGAANGVQGQAGSLNDYVNSGGFQDATGAGASNAATSAVQNNGILGSLFGQGGELQNSIGKEQQLQNQGFQLTPEDKSMYGQMAGDITRQFGQAENDTAANMASRGLNSSGAAGAAFSGLQGSKNEMLAGAQQQIAQQRYKNTMDQIGQQQQLISSLGQQGQNAIQGQYNRGLAGAQTGLQGREAALTGAQAGAGAQNNAFGAQQGVFNGLGGAAGLQNNSNIAANNAALGQGTFEQEHKSGNILDIGMNTLSGMGGAFGGAAGKGAGQSLFAAV